MASGPGPFPERCHAPVTRWGFRDSVVIVYDCAPLVFLRPMHRPLARLRSFIAALLVAVLVIVPAADAFACSFEFDTEHAAAAADDHSESSAQDDAGKGDSQDGAHGICAHNHCHHSSAHLWFSASVTYDTTGIVLAASPDSVFPFGVSEGPMRPPRS